MRLRPLFACALAAAALAATPAAAEPPPDVDAVAGHLALLGYQCQRKADRLDCQHAQNVNMSVRGLQGGLLFISFLATEDAAKTPEQRAGVLDFVNTMNANSTMVIFFIDKDGDLGASAWSPARYDRTTFGQLIERWNTDIREALQRDPDRARALIR
jgi:hypothetical protein